MRRFLALLLAVGCCAATRMPNPREQLVSPPKADRFFEPRGYPVDPLAPDSDRHRAALRELAVMRNAPPPPPGPPPPPPPPPPNDCPWSFTGPTNIHGRVTDIAIDPLNHNRLFAATVGGVWRSTDFARRWERVSDSIFAGVFGSVAINANEIFIGGGDPNLIVSPPSFGVGIWRSTSNGDPGSWSPSGPPELTTAIIYRLRVDTKAAHDIYAATSIGVWRGVHSGGTVNWSRIGGFDAWTSDIVIDPSGANTLVYAGVQKPSATKARGVWKWDGTSWQPVNNGIEVTNTGTIKLAIAKSSPGTLYARVTGESTVELLQGIYKTTNGGGLWNIINGAEKIVGEYVFNAQMQLVGYCGSGYTAPLEVDPTDPDLVYSGCVSLYRMTNGQPFQAVSAGADAQYQHAVHVDHHVVAFDPVNPKIVYAGHDGGIDRSTDTSVAPWHWASVFHGVTNWQMYHVTTQPTAPTMAAGGAQDTGTAFTFGNRGWYAQTDCDGTNVAFDAKNVDTFYFGCQGPSIQIRTNPVVGTAGFGTTTIANPKAFRPFVTDRDLTRHAIAVSQHDSCSNAATIMSSTDGVNFSSIGALPNFTFVNAMHIVAGSNFQHYYAAVTNCGNDQTTMWRTTNGGGMWDKISSGIPPGRVGQIDADPEAASGDRAFISIPSSILMSADGGASWVSIDGSGATALPPSSVRRGVAIDPADANVVYAATDVGVFRGTLSGNSATWEPFDEGMPGGVDVRELSVDRNDKALVIGTWGFGTWRRSVDPAVSCPSRALLVRDNIFDRGKALSPSGIPDPEHPLPDPANPPFFKPDDSLAGKLYWWSSTDVRIDVPEADPFANQIDSADNTELESCSVLASQCPAGTLLDSHPHRGRPAKAYVQVYNAGKDSPVMNARVIALWTDTSVSTPQLPNNFWTATFPAPGTPCGAIAPGPWHLVNAATPCQTIGRIDPPIPEVAKFDWDVPANAPDKACFLAIVESADDPLPASIRNTNELNLFKLVQQNRHITVRNLHIVDPPPPGPQPPKWFFAEAVSLFNPTPDPEVSLLVSQVADIRILLPREIDERALENVRKVKAELTAEERRFAEREKFDPDWQYVIGPNALLRLPVRPGETWRIGLLAHPEGGTQLRLITMHRDTVLGGSTYVFRGARTSRPITRR